MKPQQPYRAGAYGGPATVRALPGSPLAAVEAAGVAASAARALAVVEAGAPGRERVQAARVEDVNINGQDLAWTSAEHARVVAEIRSIVMVDGDEGAELAEALENVVAAMSAFDAATSKKAATVQALHDRAKVLGTHAHQKHRVMLEGIGSPANQGVPLRDAWDAAGATIRALVSAACAEHGVSTRARWVLEQAQLGVNEALRVAHVARSRVSDVNASAAREAAKIRDR